MRKGLVCTAIVLGFVLAPLASQADDVQDQLQRMEDRMAEMEDRLQATNDQLNAANDVVERQQDIIDRSGIADQDAGTAGVAAFLDSLEIGGWLAGSYWYNFNQPRGEYLGGANSSAGGLMYPFHPDTESFQVDQLWFELERPVTESQRAGFRADICYGKTCDILSNGSSDGDSLGSNDLNVYQAYIQYLAPVGEGATFKFGKFGTLIGAEVVPTVYNFNVTRGNVYSMLQPINHLGIMVEMEFGDGFHGALGYVNGNVDDRDIDNNRNKGVTGQIGWSGETAAVRLSGIWGSSNDALNGASGTTSPFGEGALESDKDLIADLVITWDPTPEFSMWLNGTYREVDLDQVTTLYGSDAEAWGVAIAGRYALSDRLGVSLRGEYLDDEDSFFSGLGFQSCVLDSGGNLTGCGIPGENSKLWSVTGTLDYSLTEQLMLRGEVRYDRANMDDVSDDIFNDQRPGDFNDDQLVAGVEVLYNF